MCLTLVFFTDILRHKTGTNFSLSLRLSSLPLTVSFTIRKLECTRCASMPLGRQFIFRDPFPFGRRCNWWNFIYRDLCCILNTLIIYLENLASHYLRYWLDFRTNRILCDHRDFIFLRDRYFLWQLFPNILNSLIIWMSWCSARSTTKTDFISLFEVGKMLTYWREKCRCTLWILSEGLLICKRQANSVRLRNINPLTWFL
jgi:hypothetical protein